VSAAAALPVETGVRLSDDKRYYLVPSCPTPLPRVSTVLSVIRNQGLDDWKRKVGFEEADRVSEESSALGTRVHAACEAINRGRPYELTDEIEPFAAAWTAWKDRHVEEILFAEEFVWSEEYGFAGTIDAVALLKNGLVALLDFKSSKYPHWEYRLQTVAYAVALREREGLPVDRRALIQMPSKKPGTLNAIYYPDDAYDWSLFRAALHLWKGQRHYADDWKLGWQR
jgi:predicted RecB family nuclease